MTHVILNLHGLGDPRPELPEDEARYWVQPDLLAAAIAAAKSHAPRIKTDFTFDDGNLSDLEIGAPMLSDAGFQATFFVLSARIGEPHYLSGDDLRALMAMGHRIGHHGADHVDWTALDEAGVAREMSHARARIEAETQMPVTETAIPFGRYNAGVLRQLKDAGFTRAYSSDGGPVRSQQWPLPRTSLTCDMTADSIEDILQGREPAKRKLRRSLARLKKRWV